MPDAVLRVIGWGLLLTLASFVALTRLQLSQEDRRKVLLGNIRKCLTSQEVTVLSWLGSKPIEPKLPHCRVWALRWLDQESIDRAIASLHNRELVNPAGTNGRQVITRLGLGVHELLGQR